MDKKFWGFFGVGLVVGFFALSFLSGCATRTKMIAGPLQVTGQARVFDSPQGVDLTITSNGISVTVGYIEATVGCSVGPCEKIIGLELSTGDTDTVLKDSD